jgi:hypothetical protein
MMKRSMENPIGDVEPKSPKTPAVKRQTDGFIGSMAGTMEITGDILSPIELEWEADANSPVLPEMH